MTVPATAQQARERAEMLRYGANGLEPHKRQTLLADANLLAALASRLEQAEQALAAYAKFDDVIAMLMDARRDDYRALADALAGLAGEHE